MIFTSLIILSGCTQSDRDMISDYTYVLTGVPGARQKAQAEAKKEQKAKKEADEFKNRRQSWVGKSIDDLIMRRGSPWGVHKRQDGGAQYTFKQTQNSSNDPYLNNPRLCVDNFVTDKKGIIVDWSTSNCRY